MNRYLLKVGAIVCAFAGSGASRVALGQSVQAQPPAKSTVARSYAWQLASADLASFAGMALGNQVQSEPVTRIATVSFVLAAPAVHIVNGSYQNAVRSAGLRLTLPVLGAFAGLALECASHCSERVGPSHGIIIGGGLGAAAALLVDYALLSKKTERAPTRSWQPTVGASQNGFSVGAMGRY